MNFKHCLPQLRLQNPASLGVSYNDDSHLPWVRCWTAVHRGRLWFQGGGVPQPPCAALPPSHTHVHVPLSREETNTAHLSFLMISVKEMLSAYVSGRSLFFFFNPFTHFHFSRLQLTPSAVVISLSSVEGVEFVRAPPDGCFVRESSNQGKNDKGNTLFLWWCGGTSGLHRFQLWLVPWVLT